MHYKQLTSSHLIQLCEIDYFHPWEKERNQEMKKGVKKLDTGEQIVRCQTHFQLHITLLAHGGPYYVTYNVCLRFLSSNETEVATLGRLIVRSRGDF